MRTLKNVSFCIMLLKIMTEVLHQLGAMTLSIMTLCKTKLIKMFIDMAFRIIILSIMTLDTECFIN
jgi:hypothetical protein